MTWSGDAIWAIEEANAVGVDLDYEVPAEGSNIWSVSYKHLDVYKRQPAHWWRVSFRMNCLLGLIWGLYPGLSCPFFM